MKRIIGAICFLLTLLTPAFGQLYQYLDTQEGLSSRRVLSVEKDGKGYMWFLTHEGIDRYNGKQYKHYKLSTDKKTLNGFPNLNTLLTDSTGTIWEVGKSGHIFRYNSLQDQFELMCDFAAATGLRGELPLTASYFSVQDHRLLLCTQSEQYLLDASSRQLVRLESPIHEEITYVAQTSSGQYYLATAHKIYGARIEDNRLKIIKHPELDNFHIVNYVYVHPGTQKLVIGTLQDGIFVYDTHSRRLLPTDNSLKDINVNSIIAARGKSDEVLIATNGAGVYTLNLSTCRLSPFLTDDQNRSNQMNGNIINDLYMDEEQRLWMAVYPVGITIYSGGHPGYKWIQHSYDNLNSLINNQVNYLLEDSDGDIWYATNNGVCCYSPHTGQWRSLLSTYQHDTTNQNHVFLSLCESSPGIILVGGYMSGMYKITKRNMAIEYFVPHFTDNNIKPDKYIRCIYKDRQGLIWAGGYYNLKSYDRSTQEMRCYKMDFPITCIAEKDANTLWIGTINGLYQLDKTQRQMTEVAPEAGLGCINTIYQPHEAVTFIGTHGSGMQVYHEATRTFTNYRADNSALISNSIYCILPRADGNLIISTGEGLTRFKVKERIFSNWTREQGLMPNGFNQGAGIHTRQGTLIFGGGEGAIEVSDTLSFSHRSKSKMVFDNFRILYQRVQPGQKGSPLKEDIDHTRHITLRAAQNIFSLDVSSINYDAPSQVAYAWKLEGFYDEWTVPSADGRIRYTNINPGEYKLRVRAIMLDDGRLLEERSIHITVTPPFWATLWAWCLYLTVGVLLITILLRYLWLRKEREASQEKIRFFVGTAHDIRTPLTLIKAPLGEILKNETLTERGRKNITLAVQSTERLSELADNLINFEKEELYSPTLHVTTCELNAYIGECLDKFSLYAAQKQINLVFQGLPEPLDVKMDRNKMDTILRNLMSNALKYTPQGGSITVGIGRDKRHWTLTVTDTGIGIPADEQKQMFHKLFRGNNAIDLQTAGSGIGMMLTYKLVKSHAGEISMSSTENVGTTFHLAFPFNSRKYKHSATEQPATPDVLPARLPAEVLPKRQTALSPKAKQGASILIVEDNVELRGFLMHALSVDYKTYEASNGQEALDFIKRKQPDLVISDVMMPVMSGDQMCHILKSNLETSHIPVILLTALTDKASILQGLETKADKYIVKPFDLDILHANITNILTNQELLRRRYALFSPAAESTVEAKTGTDADEEFLLKVTETIKQNINHELNVETLCAAMHMSRSSFYNKIKAITHYPPSEFIRRVRMGEASTMLRSQSYTVSEVSDLIGFGDPKYFTDIFKKRYGIPPSTYMKQSK